MIKTMTIKLKQLCSDCAIPSFSVNKEFIKIAESFGVVRAYYKTNNILHVYDLKKAEEYLITLLNIDISALHSVAILKQRENELRFKKDCEKTSLWMCNEYAEKAKNVFQRRKYQKCFLLEENSLKEIRHDIETLSKTICEKEAEIVSLAPDQHAKAIFIVSCWEYRLITLEISDLHKDLVELHSHAKKIIQKFVTEPLSLSWAKEQFIDISEKIKNSYQKLSDQLLLLYEAENKATALADQIFIKGSDPIVNDKSEKGSDSFGWVDEASWY